MFTKRLWALTALAAGVIIYTGAIAGAANLGYEVTLEGAVVGEVMRTCWPLSLGSYKGFKMEWPWEFFDTHYNFDVKTWTTPPPEAWKKYHWVSAGLAWRPPEEMLFYGDYAEHPANTNVTLDFTDNPGAPAGWAPEVTTEQPGAFTVYVMLPEPNGSGHTYCVSMVPYGCLNTSQYGNSALQYYSTPIVNLERVEIKTAVQRSFYIGAVLSTAPNLYDIDGFTVAEGGAPNPNVVWSESVRPGPENNPTVVYLDLSQ